MSAFSLLSLVGSRPAEQSSEEVVVEQSCGGACLHSPGQCPESPERLAEAGCEAGQGRVWVEPTEGKGPVMPGPAALPWDQQTSWVGVPVSEGSHYRAVDFPDFLPPSPAPQSQTSLA